jgi:hypothetical protein
MKLRTIACLIGALAISSAPFVLAVSGGGLPSSPTFQSVKIGSGLSAVTAGQLAISNSLGVGTGGNGAPSGNPGDINAAGTVTAQAIASNGGIQATTGFSGSGSGITSLNGTNISSGTVADARLTSNVVKYTDTGTNFSGATPPTIGAQAICLANGTNCLPGCTSSTWTATPGGFSSVAAQTLKYSKCGNIVVVLVPQFTGTSNSTSFSIGALPAAIQPLSTQAAFCGSMEDNSVGFLEATAVVSGGSIGFSLWTVVSTHIQESSIAWSSVGTKGNSNPCAIAYSVQ